MIKDLFARYESFCEPYLMEKRVQHQDVASAVSRLKEQSVCKCSVAGKSAEGREIYHILAGTGTAHVLLWSQMHGNEGTATRAFFDVLRFLSAEPDEFEPIRREIMNKLTLHFVPMLNPDGAERWQRENALGIDLNRDALKLTSPEAQLLDDLKKSICWSFAFNMHDQSEYYSAGNSLKPATITLLAPPVDDSGSRPENRIQAMQMVVLLQKNLFYLIPGQVAKWKDDYEARAFGENFQKTGVPVILVESGGFPGDQGKINLRRLNFYLLIEALYAIATHAYLDMDPEEYEKIPLNRENGMFDRIERNCPCISNGYSYITDIGYRKTETYDGKNLTSTEIVDGKGDLSGFGSYEECCNFIV